MAVVALGACTEQVSTGDSSAVTPFLGKELVGKNATFIFNGDGTVGGQFRDNPIVGTYSSSATEICSNLTAPANLAGDYCSTPAIDGNTVVFNRRDGSQSPVYTIEG